MASAAAEDPGSQLTTSAIASEDQVACIKSTSTSIDKNIASSSSTAFKYIYQHSSDAPARGSMHFSNQPALARTTGELCSPPAASINPEDGCCIIICCCGPTRESSRKRLLRIARNIQSAGMGIWKHHDKYARRVRKYLVAASQPVRSDRHLTGVLQPIHAEGHLEAVSQHLKRILAEAMVHRGRKLSPESLFWKNQLFPQAVFSSSRGQIRVRPANLFAILPPPSYQPLPQDMSVTLVAHPLISPRSRMFPLVVPSQRVGQIWSVQTL